MQDYNLKIAVQDLENENSYYVGDFKCHTYSLNRAMELAEMEEGFIRVIQVVKNE